MISYRNQCQFESNCSISCQTPSSHTCRQSFHIYLLRGHCQDDIDHLIQAVVWALRTTTPSNIPYNPHQLTFLTSITTPANSLLVWTWSFANESKLTGECLRKSDDSKPLQTMQKKIEISRHINTKLTTSYSSLNQSTNNPRKQNYLHLWKVPLKSPDSMQTEMYTSGMETTTRHLHLLPMPLQH